MFVFFSVFQCDSDCTAHIISLVVNWQFDLLLAAADLVVLLVLLQVELYIDLNTARQTAEEGTEFVLNFFMCTIALSLIYIKYFNSRAKSTYGKAR